MSKQNKKLARAKRIKKKMNVERSQKTTLEKVNLRNARTKVTWSHTKRAKSKITFNPILT